MQFEQITPYILRIESIASTDAGNEPAEVAAVLTMGGGSDTCDFKSAAVFVVGLTAGTFCTIASKMLFEQTGVGKTGAEHSSASSAQNSCLQGDGTVARVAGCHM